MMGIDANTFDEVDLAREEQQPARRPDQRRDGRLPGSTVPWDFSKPLYGQRHTPLVVVVHADCSPRPDSAFRLMMSILTSSPSALGSTIWFHVPIGAAPWEIDKFSVNSAVARGPIAA